MDIRLVMYLHRHHVAITETFLKEIGRPHARRKDEEADGDNTCIYWGNITTAQTPETYGEV